MNVLRWIASPLADYGRAAMRVLSAAPWLLLPVLLAEGAQHVVEIKLGMFASREIFAALAQDATRMAFGYTKIAGLVISFLLVARFVATGSIRRALLPSWRSLLAVLFLVGLTTAMDMGFKSAPARAFAPELVLQSVNFALQVALTALLLAALFEDRWPVVKAARWRILGAIVASGALPAMAFVPMQMLHRANHLWALEQPLPVVLALMLFDTLLVGGMALALGAGAAVGWRRFVSAAPHSG